MTNRWLLPENLADVLPAQALQVEELRRVILDLFESFGYQLVIPPMLEYVESLLTATGSDMSLQIFKLVDQLSGRTLGIRSDMTTQVARIDAHILKRQDIARLCYAGTTLQTRVVPGIFSREQLQLGAEIYGFAGIAADIEIGRLMLDTLYLAQVGSVTLDMSHAALLRDVIAEIPLSSSQSSELYAALQAKDRSSLEQLTANWQDAKQELILSLLDLSGDAPFVLERARQVLPNSQVTRQVLGDLETLYLALHQYSNQTQFNIDLADLAGYQYHTGVMSAAYIADCPVAIARGGRYDEVGSAFGRSRPATGFSLDILPLANLSQRPVITNVILAPCSNDPELLQKIRELRQSGQVVIQLLPGESGKKQRTGVIGQLDKQAGIWQVHLTT
ncbi:MAG: ATP phosphoribosyltransferase regulatory subunit [Burkholderiales bacterium]|nr:ATP phosphoribosyltransferase regulatory subunit [Burkholderiales bacterium]